MKKQIKSVLFVVAASLVQVILVGILATVLFVPYAFILGRLVQGPNNLLALIILVAAAYFLAMPIYRRIIEALQNRIDFDKHFEAWAKLPPKKQKS